MINSPGDWSSRYSEYSASMLPPLLVSVGAGGYEYDAVGRGVGVGAEELSGGIDGGGM